MLKEILTNEFEESYNKMTKSNNGSVKLKSETFALKPLKFFVDQLKKSIENTDIRFSTSDRSRIILEEIIGEKSVDAICENENISFETFNEWKTDFFKNLDNYYLQNENNNSSSARKSILEETSLEVYNYFSKYINFSTNKNFVLPAKKNLSSYSNFNNIENVIVLDKLNNFRKINKHLELINAQLPSNGLLLGSFETFTASMNKSKLSTIPVIKNINSGLVFLFKRVLPKLPHVNKFYFNITKGKNRLLSKAESLGRLVSCGFEIVDYKDIDGIHYFVAKKTKQPDFNMNPSFGPLFKMNRVGKNGKIIGVYKFRTMHPYSEYLQEYILKVNGYSKTGKPANDFRVVPWAKVLRRYWIDELPQLINVLKGDMKLVGIRPVSETYFKSIPEDIQKLRLTQKPGCIPPYVALNRKSSVESVLEAEKEYLMEKIKNPYFTDTKYFFKAIYNIVIKNKRSA